VTGSILDYGADGEKGTGDDVTYTIDEWSSWLEEHLSVIGVQSIEYCRMDKDQSDETNWVTSLNIAAGARNTDVHKARVRITITPPVSGVSITAERDGGDGVQAPASFSQDGGTTDGSGAVYGTYTSSDKMGETPTIKVTECEGYAVDIAPGSTLHHRWDMAGEYDFSFPTYFVPGEPDDVSFYPTLEESGGRGAIDGHDVTSYTRSAVLYCYSYDFENATYTLNGIYAPEYPSYADFPPFDGVSMGQLIEHSETAEGSSGVYTSTHTVNDYWDFDSETGTLQVIEPQQYSFGFYDESVSK
jgi:hypothetical protein